MKKLPFYLKIPILLLTILLVGLLMYLSTCKLVVDFCYSIFICIVTVVFYKGIYKLLLNRLNKDYHISKIEKIEDNTKSTHTYKTN